MRERKREKDILLITGHRKISHVLFGYCVTIALALFQTFQYPRNLEKWGGREGEEDSRESVEFVEPPRYAGAFDRNAETRDEMDVRKKERCLIWTDARSYVLTFIIAIPCPLLPRGNQTPLFSRSPISSSDQSVSRSPSADYLFSSR